MHSAIPLGHRLRLLCVYSRLTLLYNVLVSFFGALALLLVGSARLLDVVVSPVLGDSAGVTVPGVDSVRSLAIVAGLLVATAGHWMAVLVVNLVHYAEQPLYRSGGWGRVELMFAAWLISIAIGVAAIVAARM